MTEQSTPRTSRPKGLLKISEVARLSGVPTATIKHYLREGLLPPATQKTGRNMSWYDPQVVERIITIKTLQRERFLPLKLIRELLEQQALSPGDQLTANAIERMMERESHAESVAIGHLLQEGLRSEDLAWLTAQGLIEIQQDDTVAGEDLALARLIGRARRAGLHAELVPVDFLARYKQAVHELVKREIELFRAYIEPGDIERDPSLAESAIDVSEQLVLLLRRKALLPVFRAMLETETSERSE